MQANRRVSAPRRDLPAASIVCRARYARFIVAEDAEEGDPGSKPSGIQGMSDKQNPPKETAVAVVPGFAGLHVVDHRQQAYARCPNVTRRRMLTVFATAGVALSKGRWSRR
jgi:hypothetical protein